MTVNMRARIDPATFELNHGGSVSGVIWLSIDGRDFPEAGWYDFPLKLLLAWQFSCGRLATLGSGTEDLSFMDGPFRCVLGVESGEWSATLFERGVSIGSPEIIDGSAFRASVFQACRESLRVSIDRGWNTDEVAQLTHVVGTGQDLR